MNKKSKYTLISALACSILLWYVHVSAQDMNDYTAYPPFVTNAVEPNILLVLDYSGSMQFPAYFGCDFQGYSSRRASCGTSDSLQEPQYAYDAARDYYGYFKAEKYYEYGTNKFLENAACAITDTDPEHRTGNNAGCISGNLLNWATMTRTDLLRKALIGGKSVGLLNNAHTLRGEGGWWRYTDTALGCSFSLSGGGYPNLDHKLTITDSGIAGTCGNLAVWASGSMIWDRSDEFRYVYQSVSGNFDARLLIETPPTESGQTYAKAGLMVRGSTTADSLHVKAMATNGSGLQFSDRLTDGGTTNLVGTYVPHTYPAWVRIVRSGNDFTYYYSADGVAWNLHGSSTLPGMPASVLIGMASSSYSSTLGKAEYNEFICDVCSDDDFDDGFFNTAVWTAQDISTSTEGSQSENCNGVCAVGTLSNANVNVDIPEREKSGVIQAVSDKDLDGHTDPGAPRFGLMTYNSNNKGCIRNGVDDSSMISLLTALQGEPAYSGTPTGEALDEAWDYFRQVNSHSGCNNNAYVGGQGSNKDPWYDKKDPVPCRKSFVLLISDGEWNGRVDPVIPARRTHINDIRPDIDGKQTLKHFSVYTFSNDDTGKSSMQQIGMYGGFDDYDHNTWPFNRTGYPADSRTETLPAPPCDAGSTDARCKEWDTNADGIPDTYYEASQGEKLEASLVDAIANILKQSSSGTAVSVLATTGEGEGSIYQAFFYPQKLEGIEPRAWFGYLNSLFIDKNGNLREDSNDNDTLDLTSDFIIEMNYDRDEGTRVHRYRDMDGNGEKDSDIPASTGSLDDIKAVWNGGEILWEASSASRKIYTTLNGYSFSTGLALSPKGNFYDDAGNVTALQPSLRAADDVEAANIINWIRGDDLTGVTDKGHPDGYRKRDITINGKNNVWKLGDIIYSTPTVVARPMENYDLLYGDSSYTTFRLKHSNRRNTVYVGANDGMLHAFNGGCFDGENHRYYSDVDSSGKCTSGSHTLGQELWSFIPRGLLPHLKWNTLPEYTHVYHVDMKPKITDVKIFSPDNTHSKGWGTILIGGFRYGGKAISWNSKGKKSASPEYFAMDITDPLNPRLLWTFSDPDLGLSMSYPAVAKVEDNWYAIFGSGATDYDSSSNLLSFQKGTVFVLKISSGTNGVVDSWDKNINFWKKSTGTAASFLSNPITIDVDLDYNVDVMYIGENYKQGSTWNGVMRRITTNEGLQPLASSWVLSTLGNVNSIAGNKDVVKKITSAPSAAMDDGSNLWVFFGTGQFYGLLDKNNTDSGGFYGLRDGCWDGSCTSSYTNVMDISGASVKTDGSVSGVSGLCGSGTASWSSLLSSAGSCDGWAMYFGSVAESVDYAGDALYHAGERMLSKPMVLGGLVTFSTYIPGFDKCSFEGESNVYAVYYKTGTANKKYVFNEQKNDTNPSDIVGRVKKLGPGMPSSVSAQVTSSGSTKGFVQSQSGSILSIETSSPFSLRSGIKGWMSDQVQ